MAHETLTRKREFKAALAMLGMTVTAFADKQGVSLNHLYECLNERRVPGAGLSAAIDDVIARGDKAA